MKTEELETTERKPYPRFFIERGPRKPYPRTMKSDVKTPKNHDVMRRDLEDDL